MARHIEKARKHLGELHGLAQETEAAEQEILKRAQARLELVSAQIERQRPGIMAADDDAQSRYLALVQERAQLNLVIARARSALRL